MVIPSILEDPIVHEGPIYYLPKRHVLVQVRELDEGHIKCTDDCKYWNDAKTCSKIVDYFADDRSEWIEIDDPKNFPQYFELYEHGWRVKKIEPYGL